MQVVRHFLADLAEGRNPGGHIPGEFTTLAARASRGTGIGSSTSVEDVVAEYLSRACAGEARAVGWRNLADGEVRALVLRRLRQLAVELSPAWNQHRALRSHVAHALATGLPPPPDNAPAGIVAGGRICASLVAVAASWLRRQSGYSLGSAPELARALAARYLPAARSLAAAPGEDEPDVPDGLDWGDELAVRLDAVRLCVRAREALGPEATRLLVRRQAGAGFEELARDLGVSVGTTFARVGRAEGRFVDVVRQTGVSREATRLALQLLREVA